MRLRGKTVVITGASSGIGKATAARCLDEGARIVAVSDRPGELEQTAAELAPRGEIHPIFCDVSAPDQVKDLAARVAELGGAHILMNNAGEWNERYFRDIEFEYWNQMMSVNLTG